MTKADIISKIVEQTGLPKKDVAVTVEAFMKEIRTSMAENHENVFLRGFGTFTIKHRAQKTARNISKNVTMVIDAQELCQTERKRRATRWLHTSVRRDCARIVIRASKLHLTKTY